MITATVTGSIPLPAENLSGAMRRIAERVYGSILQNFASGGRPTWLATKDGKAATLGAIKNRGGYSSGDNWALIRWMNTVHQRGPLKTPTPLQRKFFWHQYKQSGYAEEKWKAMALAKVLRYPERKYAMLQQEDFDFIRETLKNSIFTVKESIV